MQYTVYKVTNQLNGKHYVGAHATTDLDDCYVGSGTALLNAIKRHGRKNFDKETLAVFDNADDMFAKEAEIVNEQFVADRKTYNIKLGGKGGLGSTKSEEHKQAIAKAIKDKYDAGTLSRTGGRSPMTPEILTLVKKHGIQGAADTLGITHEAARCRYYRMKKN